MIVKVVIKRERNIRFLHILKPYKGYISLYLMKTKRHIFILGIFYLIPCITELLYNSNDSVGNIHNMDIFIDIHYKRNCVYTTTVGAILFSFIKMYMLRYFFYCLFLFSTYSYLNTIKKYHLILS
jgi:hypothetical protein